MKDNKNIICKLHCLIYGEQEESDCVNCNKSKQLFVMFIGTLLLLPIMPIMIPFAIFNRLVGNPIGKKLTSLDEEYDKQHGIVR